MNGVFLKSELIEKYMYFNLMSVHEFAKMAGVSPPVIFHAKNGKSVSKKAAIKIAKAIDVPVAGILEWRE